MSTQTTTYSTAGSNTYTAPSTLLNGSVSCQVDGSTGGGGSPGSGAGEVIGTVTVAAGGTLTAVVGGTDGHGQHAGGAAGSGANPGGGSSAILSGATLLIEAGGGGGLGRGNDPSSGLAGAGGLSPTNGGAGTASALTNNGGGGGGGGNQGAGSAGGAPGGSGAGGTAPGGGGQGGTVGAGTGGGGGAGGRSFAAAAVGSPTYNDGAWNSGIGQVVITARVADPPLAPSLTSPSNGAYLDSNAAGVTFSWAYNPGTDSGTQTAYALRVSTDGGAYQYWNATSGAFQSSIVWNATSTSSVAVPSGKLADGHSYTWSVATQESRYSLQGPFASDRQFNGTAMPTVTVTSPSGSVSSVQPTVAWTEVLGSGDSQTAFRAVVYTQAVTLQAGFSPGVTTPTADSGTVSSAATSWAVTTTLGQGNWVAYVQVTETGGITSAWASSSFTVAFDPPATPTLVVSTSQTSGGQPIINLTVTAHDNRLSADDASFETTIGTWTAGSNTTVARETSVAEDGSAGMSLTATAGGSISASTATGTGGYPVTGGITYAAMASFKTAATARTCTVGINWYTSSGTLISGSTGTGITDATGSWTKATVTATAPSNAAYAQRVVTVATPVAAEVHYVDEAGLFSAGTAPAWSRGGLLGIETVTLQRSTDGTTWTNVRSATAVLVPSNTEQVTATDYEAPFGIACSYRAVLSASVTVPTTGVVTATSSTVTATIYSNKGWLTDPLDTTRALALNRLGSVGVLTSLQTPISFQKTRAETMGVFRPFGRATAVIQRGTIQADTFTLNAWIAGYADEATFEALADSGHTLLVRTDMGEAFYAVLGPDLPRSVLRSTERTSNPDYVVTVTCTVTDAP